MLAETELDSFKPSLINKNKTQLRSGCAGGSTKLSSTIVVVVWMELFRLSPPGAAELPLSPVFVFSPLSLGLPAARRKNRNTFNPSFIPNRRVEELGR